MKNTVLIKKYYEYEEGFEPVYPFAHLLVEVKGVIFDAIQQTIHCLHVDENYQLYLDISANFKNKGFTNQKSVNSLNEYQDLFKGGYLTEEDFNLIIKDDVGLFKEKHDTDIAYRICGQVEGDFLVAKGIYFFIDKL